MVEVSVGGGWGERNLHVNSARGGGYSDPTEAVPGPSNNSPNKPEIDKLLGSRSKTSLSI